MGSKEPETGSQRREENIPQTVIGGGLGIESGGGDGNGALSGGELYGPSPTIEFLSPSMCDAHTVNQQPYINARVVSTAEIVSTSILLNAEVVPTQPTFYITTVNGQTVHVAEFSYAPPQPLPPADYLIQMGATTKYEDELNPGYFHYLRDVGACALHIFTPPEITTVGAVIDAQTGDVSTTHLYVFLNNDDRECHDENPDLWWITYQAEENGPWLREHPVSITHPASFVAELVLPPSVWALLEVEKECIDAMGYYAGQTTYISGPPIIMAILLSILSLQYELDCEFVSWTFFGLFPVLQCTLLPLPSSCEEISISLLNSYYAKEIEYSWWEEEITIKPSAASFDQVTALYFDEPIEDTDYQNHSKSMDAQTQKNPWFSKQLFAITSPYTNNTVVSDNPDGSRTISNVISFPGYIKNKLAVRKIYCTASDGTNLKDGYLLYLWQDPGPYADVPDSKHYRFPAEGNVTRPGERDSAENDPSTPEDESDEDGQDSTYKFPEKLEVSLATALDWEAQNFFIPEPGSQLLMKKTPSDFGLRFDSDLEKQGTRYLLLKVTDSRKNSRLSPEASYMKATVSGQIRTYFTPQNIATIKAGNGLSLVDTVHICDAGLAYLVGVEDRTPTVPSGQDPDGTPLYEKYYFLIPMNRVVKTGGDPPTTIKGSFYCQYDDSPNNPNNHYTYSILLEDDKYRWTIVDVVARAWLEPVRPSEDRRQYTNLDSPPDVSQLCLQEPPGFND